MGGICPTIKRQFSFNPTFVVEDDEKQRQFPIGEEQKLLLLLSTIYRKEQKNLAKTKIPKEFEVTEGEVKKKRTDEEKVVVESRAAEVVFQPDDQHPLQTRIDGECWPPSFLAENVRSAKQMPVRAGDIFVCTYPKCGTTWIQHICSQLLFPGDYRPREGKELFFTSPMIERMGAEFCTQLEHPRLLKTHFCWQNCPKQNMETASATTGSVKYIFAVRNPKDCLVSYFHHHRNFKCYQWSDGEFDVFFELFMAGKLGFGDYFDHLLSWLPHLHDRNVLFLKYEDMLTDLEGTVQKIGKFIGGMAEQIVSCNQAEQFANVVAQSRIEAMRANQQHFFPSNALHKPSFIRKGGTRDWKNWMSREQSERLDKLFRQKMVGTEAAKWWHREMDWEDEEATIEEDNDESREEQKLQAVEQEECDGIAFERRSG